MVRTRSLRTSSLSLAMLAVVVLASVAPTLAADEYPRDRRVDVTGYRFELRLHDDTDAIEGRAIVRFLTTDAGVDALTLDLIGVAADTGMTVTAATADGQPATFTHVDDRLTVQLGRRLEAGAVATVGVEYDGVPADGLVIGTNVHGERTFFGDNWPNRARHWLPTVDHVSDKATVEWAVTAPAVYQVIGTGSLAEETDLGDGWRRTVWHNDVPVPTKVMVIGVARFAVQHLGIVGGVPLQTWVYPQDRDAGFYDFALAEPILDYFAAHIGPFPYAKLANVQSKTRFGGMENAGNIFYSERSVSGDRGSEGLIAHEIAHQWFGDSVTEADWHHAWLSEGFATYFTQLYMEHRHGVERLRSGMQRSREQVLRFHEERPDSPVVDESVRDLMNLLSTNSYQKGGWVLHMLRREVGDEAFWNGVRDYYQAYRDGNAWTADFQRVMEDASGRDLETFFAQWIFRPGQPEIRLESSWDAAASAVEIRLEQVQSGEPFSVPVDLAITVGDEVVRHTVRLEELTTSARFQLAAPPSAIALDPDTWLLYRPASQD